MTKPTLYIDCQFFQTPAWNRGMGRYTLSLLSSCFGDKAGGSQNLVLIFSKYLPRSPDMLAVVEATFPSAKIVELDLKTTEKQPYKTAAYYNRVVLDDFIAKSPGGTKAAQFFIPSLFQEPATSIFPTNAKKIVLYYDAIPFLYFQKYSGAIDYDNYLARHKTLFEADTILTISQTVADDLALYLGIAAHGRQVINIDGACIDGMMDEHIKPEGVTIPKRYILFSTSDDIRKNNRSAVLALEQLRSLSRQDYKLVITSTFTKNHMSELSKLSDHLVFTGNIPDAELAWLYKNAEAVLFTSEYEGLGLPILEAVKAGKPVACSNIPVFREISNEAFYYFDPLDTEDITYRLYEALEAKNWKSKRVLYRAIDKHYSWIRSAKLFKHALETTAKHAKPAKLPRIAILAPNPGGYSGIGKVVQELHDTMSQHFEIDYYLEQSKSDPVYIRPNLLAALTNCYDVADFNAKQYALYDAVIYHIGNSEYHFQTINNALHLPGFVILHDTMLGESFGEMVKQGYMPEARLLAEQKLDMCVGAKQTVLLTSLVNNQVGLITHSRYADQAVTAINLNSVAILSAELPIRTTEQRVFDQQKETIHIGVGGVLSGTRKGLDTIRELAKDESVRDKITLHIFGFSKLDNETITELKSYDNIRLDTDLSDLAYQTQIANLDIFFCYRSEYRGETSLTVLEAMSYGSVAIVNGTAGWFAELPDGTVMKVTEAAELPIIARKLIASMEDRRKLGMAAQNYTMSKHNPDDYAHNIAEFINKTCKVRPYNYERGEVIKKTNNLQDAQTGLKILAKKEQSND
jgi:glycosyltransferase involved in cell wall biosynthesis